MAKRLTAAQELALCELERHKIEQVRLAMKDRAEQEFLQRLHHEQALLARQEALRNEEKKAAANKLEADLVRYQLLGECVRRMHLPKRHPGFVADILDGFPVRCDAQYGNPCERYRIFPFHAFEFRNGKWFFPHFNCLWDGSHRHHVPRVKGF